MSSQSTTANGQDYFITVHLAALQHSRSVPTPSVQHVFQATNAARGLRSRPHTRRARLFQNIHREACRGCSSAIDTRAGLPGCRLWQKGRRLYDRPPALPSSREGRRVSQDGHRPGVFRRVPPHTHPLNVFFTVSSKRTTLSSPLLMTRRSYISC